MTKTTMIERAAKQYKLAKLRAEQAYYGKDCIDDFAVKLNCVPTYDEIKLVERMWSIFESLGAGLPGEP